MLHPLRPGLRKLLFGTVAVLSLTITAHAQINLASAEELVFNKPKNQLDGLINVNLRNASVNELLRFIEKESNFNFVYDRSVLEYKGNFTLDEKRISLYHLLQRITEESALRFKQVNNNINVRLVEGHEQKVPLENADVTVEGTVVDQNGEPIPGVTVSVPGSGLGTTTDLEGKYTLLVPEASTLVFSFIGFESQSIVVGDRSVIDVVLSEDISSLEEVVVTALGIERQKESLAYSVSQVRGEEFTQARELNVANALTGKIAGVNATGMATGPGGSSRIIIRGNGSLSGNNQPLYVVNGMPIDNSIPGGGTTTGGGGMNVDRGDGISGINPDDIESISVLKGGAAAALYGSRAANGVILITTKKGRARQGIGIEINSTTTFEDVAVFPDWQYEYGQGFDGRKPLTQAEAVSSGRLSYGAKMDGQPYIQFDGEMRPYSPVKDNIKDFYRMGSNFINSVAFSGGNESITYRLGVSNTDANSIVPNSSFTRKTANLNLNAFLGERLSIETVVQYNMDQGHNRPKVGYADMSTSWGTYMLANTVDVNDLAPGYDENGNEVQWNPVPQAPNPYFVVNRFQNNDTRNRFVGQANIQYDILDNLNIRGSISRDYYHFQYEGVQPTGNAFRPRGTYESSRGIVSENNNMLTLNYNTNFGNLSFVAMAGGNMQKGTYDQTMINGSEFIIPYFYSYTNLAITTTTPNYSQSAINSIFGSADFGYKEIAYLSITGRQDWFSALNPESNSIFYPSIGGTVILSEALQLPVPINFLKLRGSWAQVGGATVDPYIINQTYNMVQGGHNGRPVQDISSSLVPNPNLRPLTSTTYEVGFDAQFLDSRLGVDLTFYNRKTTDDIVQTNIATSSGYTQALLNVGELSNKGIEVLLTGNPVNTPNFKWDVSYNMAYNESEIVNLAEGLNALTIGSGVGGGSVRNVVGRPYGALWGYRKKTNEDGQIIYNTNSDYAVRGDLEEIGLGVPPLTMGITNNFTYKNFSLNVLIDGKFGSMIYSNLYQYAYRFGLPKETLPGRENGLTVSGVDEEGHPFTKTWPVEQIDTYYDNDKNYTAMFMFNSSFVKLRQVIFSYNIPVNRLQFVNLQSASVSFVARNLFILYRETEHFDPESNYTSGNAQGLEAFGVPRTRSMGLNVLVRF